MRPRRSLAAVAVAAVALFATGACGTDVDRATTPAPPVESARAPAAGANAVELVVHRSPTCSCCGGWEDAMRDAGFHVVEQHHDDMAAVKARHGIPEGQQSCHTTVVEGYVVEGHVPVAALEDLLAQRPPIDGIALAGMPAGAPGMPGTQVGPFVVTTLVDGEVTGEFGRY